jgi:hypothetical protein
LKPSPRSARPGAEADRGLLRHAEQEVREVEAAAVDEAPV